MSLICFYKEKTFGALQSPFFAVRLIAVSGDDPTQRWTVEFTGIVLKAASLVLGVDSWVSSTHPELPPGVRRGGSDTRDGSLEGASLRLVFALLLLLLHNMPPLPPQCSVISPATSLRVDIFTNGFTRTPSSWSGDRPSVRPPIRA